MDESGNRKAALRAVFQQPCLLAKAGWPLHRLHCCVPLARMTDGSVASPSRRRRRRSSWVAATSCAASFAMEPCLAKAKPGLQSTRLFIWLPRLPQSAAHCKRLAWPCSEGVKFQTVFSALWNPDGFPKPCQALAGFREAICSKPKHGFKRRAQP